MVMTIIRSMEIVDGRLLLDACWPEGTAFRYSLGREGVSVLGFPWVKPGQGIRRTVRRLIAVEGPANSITLLLNDQPGPWRRLSRKVLRCLNRSYSPLPLDDNEIGTAWGNLNAMQLYRELEQLGFAVQRTDWDTYLPAE
jgi:hypothetical protein